MTHLILCLAAASVLAQAQPRTGSDFEKRRVLTESVIGKRAATEGEVQELLTAALQDADPSIRYQAVGLLASILTFSHLSQVPEPLQWTVRLRGVAAALRPQLEKAVDDPDSRVRSDALRGIVGPIAYANPGAPLPIPMLRMLAAHFDKYPNATDRGFVITAIQSSYRSEEPEARAITLALLRKALQEQDPYLVQAAGHSATKSGAPEVLPLLVAQLKNPSYVARMGVAQGIASYGAAARPYLPQLEAALAVETHDITKKTIAGTITVITR